MKTLGRLENIGMDSLAEIDMRSASIGAVVGGAVMSAIWYFVLFRPHEKAADEIAKEADELDTDLHHDRRYYAHRLRYGTPDEREEAAKEAEAAADRTRHFQRLLSEAAASPAYTLGTLLPRRDLR